jgi:hypothetical protein
MKFKHFLTMIVTLIGLTYFSSQDASASTIDPNDEFISKIKVFDENNEQIPYTTEELKEIFTFIPEDSTFIPEDSTITKAQSLVAPLQGSISKHTYTSDPFHFKNNIYIKGGTGFYNPAGLLITPKGTAKAFTVFVINDDRGGEAKRVDFPEGWLGGVYMDVNDVARGYHYKFQFVNNSGGSTIYFTSTTVYYN